MNGLYEALGISTGAEETAPAETQEIAAPADAHGAEGGTEQEVADPAEGTEGAESGKGKQSKAENQKYARQRREREKQEAINAAVSAEQKRLEGILRDAGLIDPTSKNGRIQNLEQLEQRAKANAAKEAAKALSEGKELTKEQLMALMQNSESGREILRSTAEAENEKLGVYRTQQIALISKIDPDIKSFEDLQKIPEYEEFESYVRDNGLSWEKAYRLACGDRLTQRGAAAARQRVLNETSGKQHMTQDNSRGGTGEDLPRDVEAMYKSMNPNLTHEQCVKKYRDYLNRTQKG